MNEELKKFGQAISAEVRKDKTPPGPDEFDEEKYPFGKEPGANKFGFTVCATCGKPPTSLKGTKHENFGASAFLFKDELSAREYYISGMCQSCQDETFVAAEDEGDPEA